VQLFVVRPTTISLANIKSAAAASARDARGREPSLQRTLHSAGAVEVSGRQCSAQREVCTQPFPHNAPKDAARAFAGLLHIFLAAMACHAMATTVTTIDNRINGGGWVGGCSVRLPSLRLTLPFVPSLLLLAGRGFHVVSAGLPF